MTVVLAVTWDIIGVRIGVDSSVVSTAILLIPIVDWRLVDGETVMVVICCLEQWEVVGNVLAATTLIDLSEASLIKLISDVPVPSNSLWLKTAGVYKLSHVVVARLGCAEGIRTATVDNICLEIWRDAD